MAEEAPALVTLIKFKKLGLTKNIDKEGNDYARLDWSIRQGFPRINVYTTNVKTEDNKLDYDKIIIAPFDDITLLGFIKKMRSIITKEGEASVKIDCLNFKFENGVRTKEMYLQATVIFGKDAEGNFYLGAIEDKKPKIKFELKPSKFFVHYDSEGKPVTDKKVIAKEYAIGYINTLEILLHNYIKDNYSQVTSIPAPQNRTLPYVRAVAKAPVEPVTQPKIVEPVPVKEEPLSDPAPKKGLDITIEEGESLEDLF